MVAQSERIPVVLTRGAGRAYPPTGVRPGDEKTDAAPTEAEVLAYLRDLARDELRFKPEDVARIDLDTRVVEGLQLDSLAQVVLITQIEERYGFSFALDDRRRFESIESVRDLVRMIRVRRRGVAS
jgi:acyl carrier protein